MANAKRKVCMQKNNDWEWTVWNEHDPENAVMVEKYEEMFMGNIKQRWKVLRGHALLDTGLTLVEAKKVARKAC